MSNDYSIVFESRYDVESSVFDENGYVHAYTIFDDSGFPKFLLYLVKTKVDFVAKDYNYVEDSELIESILEEIKGKASGAIQERKYIFQTGVSLDVIIESKGNLLPGHLFYVLNNKELYKLLFMYPNAETCEKWKHEQFQILNSFKLL